MSKSARLKALLGQGYFPEELPPPFTTSSFAKFRKAIGDAWALEPNYPRSVPEIFSIPRAKGTRRYLSVVNPVAEYHVSKIISENWISIRTHLRSCSYTAEGLEISTTRHRAVPKPDFTLVSLRQAEISSMYDNVLIGDVSRFYGTLYTHSIPWALHTKDWAKAHLNTPALKATIGDQLDVAVRKGNDNQTIGIPVGPDSSRIISEIVIVAVDKLLRDKVGLSRDAIVRNVDDWYIGFDTAAQAETAMAALAAACRDFQLEIHPEKSRIASTGSMVEPFWPVAIQRARIRPSGRAQERDIDHYFSEAFQLLKENPDANVLDYAVKRTMSARISKSNWHRYETYLLKTARTNQTAIPAVVQILTSYNHNGFVIGKKRIRKLIVDLIRTSAPLGHHAEVAWALFMAKALRVSLANSEIQPVLELESSTCALITLDLRSRGLIEGSIDTSLWQTALTKDGLRSNMWMLSYEAAQKGWMPQTQPNHIDADPHFRILKKYGVYFYDENKNVTPISRIKPRPASPALLNYLRIMRFAGANLPFGGMSMGP